MTGENRQRYRFQFPANLAETDIEQEAITGNQKTGNWNLESKSKFCAKDILVGTTRSDAGGSFVVHYK